MGEFQLDEVRLRQRVRAIDVLADQHLDATSASNAATTVPDVTNGPSRYAVQVPTEVGGKPTTTLISLGAEDASVEWPGWKGGTWLGITAATSGDAWTSAKNVTLVAGATGSRHAAESLVEDHDTIATGVTWGEFASKLALVSLGGTLGKVSQNVGMALLGSPVGSIVIEAAKKAVGLESAGGNVALHARNAVHLGGSSVSSNAYVSNHVFGGMGATLSGGLSASVLSLMSSVSGLVTASVTGGWKASLVGGNAASVSSRHGKVDVLGKEIQLGCATSEFPMLQKATKSIVIEAEETVLIEAKGAAKGAKVSLSGEGVARVVASKSVMHVDDEGARLLVGNHVVSLSDKGITLFRSAEPIARAEATTAAAKSVRDAAEKVADAAVQAAGVVNLSDEGLAMPVVLGLAALIPALGVGAGAGLAAGIGVGAGAGALVIAAAIRSGLAVRAASEARDATVDAANAVFNQVKAGAEAAETVAVAGAHAIGFPAITLGEKTIQVSISQTVSITLDETSITLKAGQQTITVGANGVTIDAGPGTLTLKAGGKTATLDASGLSALGVQAL